MTRKVIGIVLSFIIIIPGMIYPVQTTDAKTLGDLKKELQAYQDKMQSNQQQQQLTQEQLNTIYSNINGINDELNQIQSDLLKMSQEITQYEEDIKKKDTEMKDIITFYQVSNGESAYLEFAFGAKDFTDFIYRMAISEQLVNYNKKLIKEYNDMIEANQNRKKELANKQVSLNVKQEEMQREKAKLGEELSKFSKESISIENEIKLQKEAIDFYEKKLKCKDDEDISVCGRDKLPPGTAFYRPIITGYTTSEFGSRCYNLNGVYTCDVHAGLDFTAKGNNIPVYAAGNGMVIGITERAKCGGNMVYVHHNINGKTYTSLYAHLRKITVTPGQVVTKDTQVGIMGGTSAEWWDGCSTGMHVHFSLANGLYLKDYYSWSTFEAKMFNPRIMVNAPRRGVTFKDRLTKY